MEKAVLIDRQDLDDVFAVVFEETYGIKVTPTAEVPENLEPIVCFVELMSRKIFGPRLDKQTET